MFVFIFLLSFGLFFEEGAAAEEVAADKAANSPASAMPLCYEAVEGLSKAALKQRLRSMTKQELQGTPPSWFKALGEDIQHLHPSQTAAIPEEAMAALTEEQWMVFSKEHFENFTLPQMQALSQAKKLLICQSPHVSRMNPDITACFLREALSRLTKTYQNAPPEDKARIDKTFRGLL